MAERGRVRGDGVDVLRREPAPVGAARLRVSARRRGTDRLGRGFYARPSQELARRLLGCVITRAVPGDGGDGLVRAVIVETEAYCGPADQGSHARNGLRTARNEAMYGPAGLLYVYFTYGMHHCANVVCAAEGVPEAVLLRAASVVRGAELVRRERRLGGLAELRHDRDLLRGPGRLCAGLGISRRDNGQDLATSARVWIEGRASASEASGNGADAPVAPSNARPGRVLCGPRIGLSARAGAWADRALRFWIADHPAVSGPSGRNVG
ncbi:MAG: DNA-3-methyladenine glycosylase [Planctomyces sp.]|nr:DNA-3-methyladenine glycosylase [Planctomyces sp.]